MSHTFDDDEPCSMCRYLEDDLEDANEKIELLEKQIEILIETNGKGYDELPSTASRIKSMEELRTWVANHNKAMTGGGK